MYAARPGRLRACFSTTALIPSKRASDRVERVCGIPIHTTNAPALLIRSISPPTRRVYSRRQAEPSKESIVTPSGRPVM